MMDENKHSRFYYSDTEFKRNEDKIPHYLKGLYALKAKAWTMRKNADAIYEKKHDLRKTVFGKFYLFFVNQILIIELITKHLSTIEETLERVVQDEATGNFLTNFVKFPMRNLRDESIEMVEHLMASLFEAKGIKITKKRYGYESFSKMLKNKFLEKILGKVNKEKVEEVANALHDPKGAEKYAKAWMNIQEFESYATFLQCWVDERNTCHRNGVWYKLKSQEKEVALVILNSDHDLKRLDRLLGIVEKITSDEAVKTIPFSNKNTDPLYDDLS